MALTKFNYNSFDITTAASKGLAFNSSANGFETAAEGSMTLIKTLTASSSANLTFVHGTSSVVLDSTYPVYLFKFINVHPATNLVQFRLNFTTDGTNFNVTKTTTMFYAYHAEDDGSTGFGYSAPRDLAQSTSDHNIVGAGSDVGNANDDSCSGEVFLFNPSSTTFVKHFMTKANSSSGEGLPFTNYTAGYGNTTSAITGVKFVMSSGNIDSGVIKLYGIKDS